MFNVTWLPVNQNTIPAGDVSPSQVDIVGNSANPALFVASDANFVYFRLRVDGDPIKNNGTLDNSVWGFLIKSTTGTPQLLVRVNGKNDNAVQVYTAVGDPNSNNEFESANFVCGQPIVLGTNVEVAQVTSTLPSSPDFFVDFRVPLSCFGGTFVISEHIYCGFTSQDENNINKEAPPPYTIPAGPNPLLCGGSPPPPASVSITKAVEPLTGTTCPTPPQRFTVSITVTNTSAESLSNLTLTDVITSNFIITNGVPYTNVFSLPTLAPGASTTVGPIVVEGYFTTPGTYPFNTATVLDAAGAILGQTTDPEVTVTQCRGLLFS